jgi:hypothetical protein
LFDGFHRDGNQARSAPAGLRARPWGTRAARCFVLEHTELVLPVKGCGELVMMRRGG